MSKQNRAAKVKVRSTDYVEPEDRKSPYHAKSHKILRLNSAYKPYLNGQPFVIDMDYECNRREETSSRSQLEDVYGVNSLHPEGFQLHFTSIDKHKQFYMQHKNGMLDPYFCYFHEKPFWELFPRERLVYLSPDAPRLRSYNGNDIYVMGGLVDLNNTNERKSYAKAKELGIRVGSFPIGEFGV